MRKHNICPSRRMVNLKSRLEAPENRHFSLVQGSRRAHYVDVPWLEIVAPAPSPVAARDRARKLAAIRHFWRLSGRNGQAIGRSFSMGREHKEKHAMGHLNTLALTALKGRAPKTPQEQRRAKLCHQLEEQLAMYPSGDGRLPARG
jgi:hypothetical protein